MTKANAIWALGAMSGTSLDGVDAAMVLTDGREIFDFGNHAYRTYSETERDILRQALGKIEGAEVEAAAELVEVAHAELFESFPDADLIGFHGQTVSHLPEQKLTVQVGNGQVLAEATGRPVVWDFRSADMRLGGQGAPLAPFYHFALARYLGLTEPVAFLNIGGVGNLTWLDPTAPGPEAADACLAFDTGPGNALIDDLCKSRFGIPMDKDGSLAREGNVDEQILNQMMQARYLLKIPPKSLDRNDFSEWSRLVSPLCDADAIATLTAGTVAAVKNGLSFCTKPPGRLLVTGGGRLNKTMMQRLSNSAACPVETVEQHGLNGDMLEAQAFAYLAVRVARGLPTSAPGTTGVAAPVGGGQISRPRSQSGRK